MSAKNSKARCTLLQTKLITIGFWIGRCIVFHFWNPRRVLAPSQGSIPSSGQPGVMLVYACLRHILNLVLLGIPTNYIYIYTCKYIYIYIYYTYHISSLVAMTNHLYHVFWLPDTPWHTCCKLRKDILFGVIYTVELGVKLVGFKARFFKEPWRGQAPTCRVLM